MFPASALITQGSQVCWTTSVFIFRSEGIMPVPVGTQDTSERRNSSVTGYCVLFLIRGYSEETKSKP